LDNSGVPESETLRPAYNRPGIWETGIPVIHQYTTDRVSEMRSGNGNGQGMDLGFDVREFENKLHSELRRLNDGFEGIKQKSFSMSQQESLGIESAYDQHPADIGTETFERGKDLGLKDGLEIGIARVRGALDRIRQGKYGLCLSCKQPIPVERLRAAPEVELCVPCQEEQEVVPRSRRPVEELVIEQDFPGEGHDEEPGDEPPLN